MTRQIAVFLAALALVVSACGGGDDDSGGPDPTSAPTPPPAASGDPAAGETAYAGTCAACHGPDLMGVTGLGKALIGTEFVAAQSDAELLAFLKIGRPTSDPLNTTGVDMPPKGGNPSLDDDDLRDIIAFIRSMN